MEYHPKPVRQMSLIEFLKLLKGTIINFIEKNDWGEDMDVAIVLGEYTLGKGSHFLIYTKILRGTRLCEGSIDLEDLSKLAANNQVIFPNRERDFRYSCVHYDTLPS